MTSSDPRLSRDAIAAAVRGFDHLDLISVLALLADRDQLVYDDLSSAIGTVRVWEEDTLPGISIPKPVASPVPGPPEVDSPPAEGERAEDRI